MTFQGAENNPLFAAPWKATIQYLYYLEIEDIVVHCIWKQQKENFYELLDYWNFDSLVLSENALWFAIRPLYDTYINR